VASRWMQGMKEKQRRFSRDVGNESLTEAERKFFLDAGRKTVTSTIEINTPVSKDVRKVVLEYETDIEGDAACQDKVHYLAARERVLPRDNWRGVARLLAIPSVAKMPLDDMEKGMIKRLSQYTIDELAAAILRYRHLVRIPEQKRETKRLAHNARLAKAQIKRQRS